MQTRFSRIRSQAGDVALALFAAAYFGSFFLGVHLALSKLLPNSALF